MYISAVFVLFDFFFITVTPTLWILSFQGLSATSNVRFYHLKKICTMFIFAWFDE